MTSRPIRPFTVLVGLDGSDTGVQALERAIEVADRERGELHVLSAIDERDGKVRLQLSEQPPEGDDGLFIPWEEASRQLRQYVAQRVAAFEARAGFSQILSAVVHLEIGAPAEVLLRAAARLGADVVVVGTHGCRGTEHLVLGSVAEAAVRQAGCSVLVARAKAHPPHLGAAAREAAQATAGQEPSPRRHTYHYVPRNVRHDPRAALPSFLHAGRDPR